MLLQVTEQFEEQVSKFQMWTDNFIHLLPNIALAIAFFIFMIIVARYARKLTERLMHRQSGNAAISSISGSFVGIAIIVIGFFLALGILGLDKTFTSLLAGAGIIGLAIGLALQDTLISAISGIIMTTRKAYRMGDFVETNGYLGTIEEINLRNTTILQTTGVHVKIPNRLVLNNPVENFSLTGERRIDITVGVSYNEDLMQVEKIVRNAIMQHVNFNYSKPVEFYWTEFGESAINFMVRLWISKIKQADYLQAKHELVFAIWKAFKENNITIPFPIRTLNFNHNEKCTERITAAQKNE
ncbi:MAG: mechanosensitive ion channel family protein [Chitinophagales bacterium]